MTEPPVDEKLAPDEAEVDTNEASGNSQKKGNYSLSLSDGSLNLRLNLDQDVDKEENQKKQRLPPPSTARPSPRSRKRHLLARKRMKFGGPMYTNSSNTYGASGTLPRSRSRIDGKGTIRSWFPAVAAMFSHSTVDKTPTLVSSTEEGFQTSEPNIPLQLASPQTHFIESIHESDIARAQADKKKRRKADKNDYCAVWMGIVLIILAIAVLSMSIVLASETNCSTSDVTNQGSGSSKERDDCGGFEANQAARVSLRNALQVIPSDRELRFALSRGMEPIPCLAPEAFNQVFTDFTGLTEFIDVIIIEPIGLQKVSSGAFSSDLAGIKQIIIKGNGIKSLPDHLFSEMTALESIDLSQNGFLSLKNNIFGNLNSLIEISFVQTSGLLEIPESLRFLERVDLINLSGCTGMVSFREQLFVNSTVGRIDFTGNHLLSINSEEDMLRLMGL